MLTPPTVVDLEREVMSRCGRLLHDAGLYAPLPDGRVPIVRYGLSQGAQDTGMMVADPRDLTDLEVAAQSVFAVERMVLWAEHHCLKLIIQGWYRVLQCHGSIKPVSFEPVYSGWLLEQKEGVKGRRDEIAAILAQPFRDTVEPVFAGRTGMDPWGDGSGGGGSWGGCCCHGMSPAVVVEAVDYPYGYRVW